MNCLLESLHFGAVLSINSLNLLLAAVDRKIIELVGLDIIHRLEGISLNSAKPGAIGVDLADTLGLVVVDTPAINPYQHQIVLKFCRRQVLV